MGPCQLFRLFPGSLRGGQVVLKLHVALDRQELKPKLKILLSYVRREYRADFRRRVREGGAFDISADLDGSRKKRCRFIGRSEIRPLKHPRGFGPVVEPSEAPCFLAWVLPDGVLDNRRPPHGHSQEYSQNRR